MQPQFLGHDLAAGEDGQVLHHGFAAIAVTGRLHGRAGQHAADLIHDERRQRVSLHILRDDQQRSVCLGELLQQRHEVLQEADLLVVEQHHRLFQFYLHLLGVGHEVGRQVALVELQSLHDFQRRFDSLGFLDRDDAFRADFLDGLGHECAERGVVVRRDSGHLFLLLSALHGT